MERRSNDPKYQMHELKRPTRERKGPRTSAAGQEDRGEQNENSSLQTNQRLNMRQRRPSEVRETAREHDTPSATSRSNDD